MPPITRSMTMGETQEEGVEKGEGSSSPKPEGNLVSMMSQMMANLKHDLKQEMRRMEARAKESEARVLATQNTLFEELNTLREKRRARPPTPRSNVVPNEVPKEFVEEGAYEGWQGGNVRDRVNHLENERFEGGNGAGNGANRRFGGGNEGYGRLGVCNQHGGMDPYVDRFRRDRYYEEEPPRRSYGEYMGNEYGMNGEGGYWDYRCYEGNKRGRHERGDESRYHGDGLDREGIRERVSRLQE